MSATPIKELCRLATKGPACALNQSSIEREARDLASARDELSSRLLPSVVLLAVEALELGRDYIAGGLEGSPAGRKFTVEQMNRALAALNGQELP